MSDAALVDELAHLGARVGVDLDPEQRHKLVMYAKLVLKWQRIANLTAARSTAQFVREHIADSLAVAPHVGRGRLLDVGSGAGLPGVVLAIACPGLDVTLLEARARRSRFLTQVKIEIGLETLQIASERLQDYRPDQAFDAAISRAFSSLADFVGAAALLRASGTRLLAMKSGISEGELRDGEALGGPARIVALSVPGFDARNLVVFESGSSTGPAAGRK